MGLGRDSSRFHRKTEAVYNTRVFRPLFNSPGARDRGPCCHGSEESGRCRVLPILLCICCIYGNACFFDTSGLDPEPLAGDGWLADSPRSDHPAKTDKRRPDRAAPDQRTPDHRPLDRSPDQCVPTKPPTEVCDGRDNDCDGKVDNGATCPTAGTTCCVGTCVDLKTDGNHCGACKSPCKGAVVGGDLKCDNGVCTLVCKPGMGNCDGQVSTGCEADLSKSVKHCGTCNHPVDIQKDPDNCGGCAHSCLGGTCLAGKCQPQKLIDSQDPYDLVVQGNHVYWTEANTGSILAMPVTGGLSKTVVTGQKGPRGLQSDGVYLFWTTFTGGQVMRSALDGTSPTVLKAGLIQPWNLALDGTTVYVATYSALGSVVGIKKDGSSVVELAKAQNLPFDLAVDNTALYFSASGSKTINRIAKTGGGVTVLATRALEPRGLLVDGGMVFWAEYATSGKIASVPIGGGQVAELCTGLGQPVMLAIHSGVLFFTNAQGHTVMKLVPGKKPMVIGAGMTRPFAIVAESLAVYLTSFEVDNDVTDGSIWKIAW